MSQRAAVIYARVSTRRQAEDGLPIESQVERCRQRAASLGATVVREFVDGGISARTDERPAFRQALDYCEQHRPEFFITWSTSRFARSKEDSAVHKRRLRECGTRLVYVSIDLDRETDAGWITESVLEVLDEFTSRQVSADTRRSMLSNAASGFWNGGRPPLGYETAPAPEDPRRKRLVVVPSEADLVRRIVAMRLQGLGARAIAVELNLEGVTNRGRRWSKSAVHHLLRNDALRGVQAYGKKDRQTGQRRPRDAWMVAESHEAIVDTPTWEQLQRVLDDAGPAPATGSPLSRWLFTGLLRCGRCGASMQIETAKGRSKRYSYYNCRAWQKHGACENRRMPAELVDQTLLDAILDAAFTDDALRQVLEHMNEACGAWTKQQKQRQREIATEMETLRRRQLRIAETIEELGTSTPNLRLLMQRAGDNEARLEQLEAALGEANAEPPPPLDIGPEDIAELGVFLRAAVRSTHNPKRTRHFLSRLVDRIIVEDEQAKVYYWPEVLLSGHTGNRPHGRFPAASVWLPGRALLGTRRVLVRWPPRLRRRTCETRIDSSSG